MTRSIASIVLVLSLAACNHEPLEVTCETYENAPPWTYAPDMEPRVVAIANATAGAWGGSAGDLLDHEIRYVEDRIYACGGKPAQANVWYRGCTSDGVIRVRVDDAPCPEATVLAHEIGHVVIGDSDHRDSRWCAKEFWDQVLEVMLASDVAADRDCVAVMRTPRFFGSINRGTHCTW